MRLIDADELKKKILKERSFFSEEKTPYIIGCIEEIPTVDLWHYPSKGEYPKEGETVLLLTNEGDSYLGYFTNEYYWETDSFVQTSACIKCWQHIVPPKEEI